jgi:hypothetical protein
MNEEQATGATTCNDWLSLVLNTPSASSREEAVTLIVSFMVILKSYLVQLPIAARPALRGISIWRPMALTL